MVGSRTVTKSELEFESLARGNQYWIRVRAVRAGKIGTTARGIGPCYSDKASRTLAIRVDDLIDADRLAAKIAAIVPIKNAIFAALFGPQAQPLDAKALTEQYADIGRQIGPMARNTGAILRGATARGERPGAGRQVAAEDGYGRSLAEGSEGRDGEGREAPGKSPARVGSDLGDCASAQGRLLSPGRDEGAQVFALVGIPSAGQGPMSHGHGNLRRRPVEIVAER